MKQIKLTTKTKKASELIGNNYSEKEREFAKKYNILIPEDQDITVSKEKPITFNQFKKKLKELHPNFELVWNANVCTPEQPQGHAVRFIDPSLELGYEPIDGVGISGETIIQANHIYLHYYSKDKKRYETRLMGKGWDIILNACKVHLVKLGLAKL